jgi:hypothetical protein
MNDPHPLAIGKSSLFLPASFYGGLSVDEFMLITLYYISSTDPTIMHESTSLGCRLSAYHVAPSCLRHNVNVTLEQESP